MHRGFSLHIRLTNDCNADCSYCSSFSENPLIMSFRDFRKSLMFIVEPFYGFTKRMLDTQTSCTGCPFQSNCTERSLDIEANGDIFICMDMADSSQYKLGNALRSEFNPDILKRLSKRKKAILEECGDCEFYMSCKGGCMSEAVHAYDSFTKKTPYCSLWKEIHAKLTSSPP